MAPKKVGPNMNVVRIKEGAPQRATYKFECADGSIALAQDCETARKTYIRRDGQTLTVSDIWGAMKVGRQKITKDLDNMGSLVMTAEADRDNSLLGSFVLSDRDTVLVLREATRKKTPKSSKAASSSGSAAAPHRTLSNVQGMASPCAW